MLEFRLVGARFEQLANRTSPSRLGIQISLDMTKFLIIYRSLKIDLNDVSPDPDEKLILSASIMDFLK